MDHLKGVDETQFKADFVILEGYIKFSGELLRLSLLALGGFGTLLLIRLKNETGAEFLKHSDFLIVSLISMICFAFCSVACLFHRYHASDSMSWYISWLRAEKENKKEKASTEYRGLKKSFKRSGLALIISQIFFVFGVLFFIIAITLLIKKVM